MLKILKVRNILYTLTKLSAMMIKEYNQFIQ